MTTSPIVSVLSSRMRTLCVLPGGPRMSGRSRLSGPLSSISDGRAGRRVHREADRLLGGDTARPRPPASRSGPRRRRSPTGGQRLGGVGATAEQLVPRGPLTPNAGPRPPRASSRASRGGGGTLGMLLTLGKMPVLRPCWRRRRPRARRRSTGRRGVPAKGQAPETPVRLRQGPQVLQNSTLKSGTIWRITLSSTFTDWKRCSTSMTSLRGRARRPQAAPGARILDVGRLLRADRHDHRAGATRRARRARGR